MSERKLAEGHAYWHISARFGSRVRTILVVVREEDGRSWWPDNAPAECFEPEPAPAPAPLQPPQKFQVGQCVKLSEFLSVMSIHASRFTPEVGWEYQVAGATTWWEEAYFRPAAPELTEWQKKLTLGAKVGVCKIPVDIHGIPCVDWPRGRTGTVVMLDGRDGGMLPAALVDGGVVGIGDVWVHNLEPAEGDA